MRCALPFLVFALLAVAAPARGAEKLLVLEPTSDATEVSAARTIGNLVVVSLSHHKDVDVITRTDVQRLAELEGEREVAGCQVESCLAELAGALGAKYVVYGDLGTLGSIYVLNLNLFDSGTARALNRVAVQGTIEELAVRIAPAADELINPLLKVLAAKAAEAAASATSPDAKPSTSAGAKPASPDEKPSTSPDATPMASPPPEPIATDALPTTLETPTQVLVADPVTSPTPTTATTEPGTNWWMVCGMVGCGGILALIGTGFDLLSSTGKNRQIDGYDFLGPALTVGGAGLATWGFLLVAPEATAPAAVAVEPAQ